MSIEVMSEQSSITVLMLCWNHSQFLQKAIYSLTEQSDKNFDVVFLDNASSDGSEELAKTLFSACGLDAKVLTNDSPCGISFNLNRLLSQTKSDIVCVISSDDWYDREYVAEVRKASENYPCSSLFYPKAYHYDDERNLVSNRPEGEFLSGNLWDYTRNLNWKFGIVGLAYRRLHLLKVGAWDEQMIAEDNDLLFRLSKGNVFIHIPKRLFYYRVSSSSISSNYVFVMKSWYQFFDKHRHYFPNKDRLLFSYGKSHIIFALKKRKLSQAGALVPALLMSFFRTMIQYIKIRATRVANEE